jgi:hypothetical protein
MIWALVWINVRDAKFYERTLIPTMFAPGGIVIVSGLMFDHGDFAAALSERDNRTVPKAASLFDIVTFLAAAAILFGGARCLSHGLIFNAWPSSVPGLLRGVLCAGETLPGAGRF